MPRDARAAVIKAGRDLFARDGHDGASVQAIARRALMEGVGVDPMEPETRKKLVKSTGRFVRAGLELRSRKDE
jgi:hypothetical protein